MEIRCAPLYEINVDAILAWVKSMTKEQFEQAGLKASVEVVMFFGFLLVSV